jgi:hypothetical protein
MVGLVRVDDGGRRTPVGERKHPAAVVSGPPGSLFVLDGMSVWRVAAARRDDAERIGGMVSPGLSLWIRPAPGGALWAANHRDVSLFVDGRWTTRRLPDAPRTKGVSAFAVDEEGAAWVKNENGLWRTDGGGWRTCGRSSPSCREWSRAPSRSAPTARSFSTPTR